jgi:serine/threonine-protein kinase
MSPEQASGLSIDHRSDIYSLGLIAYELLTGRRTFDAATPSLVLTKHVSEAPPPMTKGPKEPIPAALQDLVLRMLAKSPARRPQSMDDVLVEMGFEKPRAQMTTRQARPATGKIAKRSPLVVAVPVALILAAGVWWAWPSTPPPAPAEPPKTEPVASPTPAHPPEPVAAQPAPTPVPTPPPAVAQPEPTPAPVLSPVGPVTVPGKPVKKPGKPTEHKPALKNVYED